MNIAGHLPLYIYISVDKLKDKNKNKTCMDVSQAKWLETNTKSILSLIVSKETYKIQYSNIQYILYKPFRCCPDFSKWSDVNSWWWPNRMQDIVFIDIILPVPSEIYSQDNIPKSDHSSQSVNWYFRLDTASFVKTMTSQCQENVEYLTFLCAFKAKF